MNSKRRTSARATVQRRLLTLWGRMPFWGRAFLKIARLKLSTPAIFASENAPGANGVLLDPVRARDSILVLPIIDWEFRAQRPQHLARHLRLMGRPVTYVRKDFWVGRGLVPVELGNGVSGVFLPGEKRLNIYRSTPSELVVSRWVRVLESHFKPLAGGRRVCLVHWPFWTELALALQRASGWTVVYDCFDECGAFPGIPKEFTDLEQELLGVADLVVASSRPLFEKCSVLARNCRLLRNGVDVAHFSSGTSCREAVGADRRVRIGYVGAISEWFAAETVRGMAEARPDWEFVLVGLPTHPNAGSLSRMDNVSLVGEVPYPALPKLVGSFDVGIIPFEQNPLTWATNPVKLYEYLASGLPVVATGIPEVSRLGRLVYTAGDVSEFVAQTERALREDSPELRRIRAGFAQRHSWQRAAVRLSSWIDELPRR